MHSQMGVVTHHPQMVSTFRARVPHHRTVEVLWEHLQYCEIHEAQPYLLITQGNDLRIKVWNKIHDNSLCMAYTYEHEGLTRLASRSCGSISEMVSFVRPGCASVARRSFRFTSTSRSDSLMCAHTVTFGPNTTSCNCHLGRQACEMGAGYRSTRTSGALANRMVSKWTLSVACTKLSMGRASCKTSKLYQESIASDCVSMSLEGV